MSDIDRLNDARKKVDSIKQRRTRLEVELNVHQEKLKELEKKSVDEFEHEIHDLPRLIEELDRMGKKSLLKAEELLKEA